VPAADRVVVKQARQKAPSTPPQWPMSLAILLGLASAMGGLGAVFAESSWWVVAVGVATLVMVTLVAVRAYTRYAILVPISGALVAVLCLTFSFAPTLAYLGFIPNLDVVGAFAELVRDGFDSIADQSIPADPVPGIVFLVTVGSAVLAIALDFAAFVAKRPALTGIPLLGVLLVPTIFANDLSDPFFFLLTAVSYLLILYLGLGEVRTGGAIGVGAAGVAIALVLPLVLPPVAEPEPEGNGVGFAVGVSAFISLGDNLRRAGDTRVITYMTDAPRGVYLTVSIIDNFNGTRWSPTVPVARAGATLDAIGPVPGLDPDIDVIESTTSVRVVNMGGHWLPAPYAPRSVTGADSDWTYDSESLSIDSPTESARGEVYEVSSTLANPSVSQLRASGDSVSVDPRFLKLPEGLPELVTATAQQVTAGADNHFDKAMALQNYFTGGQFVYSETAPVDQGYDGTGAEVVAQFLEKKSGYCVHFSSAMAMMARSVGIPARIAVGFTPGVFTRSNNENPDYYALTTANLHAWPELWFEGIGWVRFEPTVGRGEAPVFGQDSTPQSPNPASSATATAAPTTTPTPTAAATPSATPSFGADSRANAIDLTIPRITISILIGAAIAVLLLPLLPVLVRTARRLLRYWRVRRRGSATEAWAELNDTAVDLGWNAATTTPRQFALLVRRGMPRETIEALGRLLLAVETTAFSRENGRSTLADLRLVRHGMWTVSTRRERLAAAFTPESAARWARLRLSGAPRKRSKASP
jgi:transglutaminase-like putative cysteine protease